MTALVIVIMSGLGGGGGKGIVKNIDYIDPWFKNVLMKLLINKVVRISIDLVNVSSDSCPLSPFYYLNMNYRFTVPTVYLATRFSYLRMRPEFAF